ncbi:signal transduction histidine kinase with CheB and CheR activity [Richelia sinica FACHB-800]|uniref:Circadian input-output histidine kinase CikA n=1 Tax=Richelia sinica FACHB-800 TaxID=1357546 RepID=A0A975Y7M1_9NOST|nr:chemotaxis protein CheB [Richelia sinica]MBD2663803.1 PAS domain-containing protein [Richelia sinica FACHB-800]QXE26490.1 signal transduction histidine kinase with CheB and CheR activity [Richelia sinica FACHB-800]
MNSSPSDGESPDNDSLSKVATPAQQNKEKELFPIVGIGASAGGLEAFTQLLSHLPTDTGMGFVLVQHMNPRQKSMLTEILSRTTQMPVTEAEDGMQVQPNHVYVIPPNATMTIAAGKLKLKPREKTYGISMTVDSFFFSLAEAMGSKAIGVVLSGGDGDGARGLETIKAAGGITFAQCEESAKVSSMPNTAVASGYVDFILTPQQIAQELANISRHPYVNHPILIKAAEVMPQSTDALSTIFHLLRAATGVDFSHYKQTTLKRRILRRMVLYRLDKLEDYAQYLQNNPAEVTALYQDVLITVTSFFRDWEAFEALKTKVFPVLAEGRRPDSPFRIWVAGCSTGEEAYSIAICLLEFLSKQGINIPIQIFATDINEVAIEKARSGIYKPSQVADISPERLGRFFVQVEGGYQISKPVRELCVFARQNLISDPPFSRLDLITCRNVLIYLSSAVQKKVMPIFHYGLKPIGFLMLGTSETVGEFSDLFTLLDKKYKIYSRKMAPGRLVIELVTSNYPLETIKRQLPVSEVSRDGLEIQKQADQIVINQYAPVGVIVNSDLEILQFRGQTSSYLEPAPGRPSFNLLKMAKEELRLELRTAIHQAKRQESVVKREGIEVRRDNQVRLVSFDVIPFKPQGAEEYYFLVLFEESLELVTPVPEVIRDGAELESEGVNLNEFEQRQKASYQKEISLLQQDLASTRDYLQSIIEEQQSTNQDLRAANEEILSSNEELQSTNEELETAKEEIQATNEELSTINDELQRRNLESTQVSNDLQNLLSSINIPILMVGGELQIRRFTPASGDIFNLIPTDVGRSLSDIKHKLNIPDLEAQILEVISTLNLKTQEVQDQDGHWYDLRIRPYRTIDHKIDGAVVVLVDIHALKQSAEELRESRDYAEAIVGTVRQSLVVLDLNLRVVTANQFFYDTFMVVREETENCLIYEIGNGQWNIPQLRSLLEDILPRQSQFQDLEVEHTFEQIGHKIMRLNARKMPQISDRSLILLAIEDITQQKQLEAERTHLLGQEQSARAAAETANRAKDEFLSILSHELRNPLNSLMGWTQLLLNKQLDEATTHQALAAIERGAKAQNLLIGDLLDISRISTGRFHLDAQTIELVPVIEAAMEIVHLAAAAKNIHIESRLDSSPRTLVGDPIRIQQVMWNLLSNSIKFTPRGGRIDVTLDYTDFQAEIQVKDTGIGIGADFLPFVFERFRQTDGSRSKSNPGLGLGLSIVRHLVELHGGTVTVESPGVGQGTTFTVKLPLQTNLQVSEVGIEPAIEPTIEPTATSTSLTPPPSPTSCPSLAGLRVLIVDDEPDIRTLFHIVLEECAVEVTEAGSAREALSILTANPGSFDVLLSDIGLPLEDGYALIRQVRSLSPEAGGQIPAAALTAYAGDTEEAEAVAAGFQMHLTKPIEAPQLISVIASLAGRVRHE